MFCSQQLRSEVLGPRQSRASGSRTELRTTTRLPETCKKRMDMSSAAGGSVASRAGEYLRVEGLMQGAGLQVAGVPWVKASAHSRRASEGSRRAACCPPPSPP
ncbi:hypothetical protein EYF80_049480 [Liparis tanakae]|uniref:Uncharacterized protein n=1 Tax=Liparis tanakae TaxID=230148 RepID=A0A4Z2FHV8_9TELE|nr:hypothetical protein EYF80_049480 [Liparis tanakae]